MSKWNQCDFCGRFISLKEFENKKAIRTCISIDSHYSYEDYETYHKQCYKLDRKKKLIKTL